MTFEEDDSDFEVTALDALSEIHRTLTAANTREGAHAKLQGYHKFRFNSAMKKYNKTIQKAKNADPNSKQSDILHAQAQHHLNMAKHHNTMMDHHGTKAFNASEEGYEKRHQDFKNQANKLLADHTQTNQKLSKYKGSSIPKSPVTPAPVPVKKPIGPSNPKIITPTKVHNVIPPKEFMPKYLTQPLKLKNPKPAGNLNKPIKQPRSGIKNNPAKPIKPAKLNIKAQPTIKVPKPPKPKTIKATPVSRRGRKL